MEKRIVELPEKAGLDFLAEIVRRGDWNKSLEKVVLGAWEEYVGWLEGVEEGPEGWVAIFDRAVALPVAVDSLYQLVGKKVGILRTDDLERPIRVRVIPVQLKL